MIKLATIVKPHGIKGACKVRAYIENSVLFNDLSEVYIKKEDDYSPLKIRSACFNTGKSSIMSFIGINNIDEIEKMINTDIFIPVLPLIEEDETYYFEELVDLKVCYHTNNGEKIASDDYVDSVKDFGSNTVLVIRHNSKEYGNIDVLINFVPSIVLEVDLKLGVIVINQEIFLQMAAINNNKSTDKA